MASAKQHGFYQNYGWDDPKKRNAVLSYPPMPSPSEYNSNYLKPINPIYAPLEYEQIGPNPQMKKRGADMFGRVTANMIASPMPSPSEYNKNYLKPINPITSPDYTPYNTDQAWDSADVTDEESQRSEIPIVQIAEMILGTIPDSDSLRKTYWSNVVQQLTKLNLLKLMRPLTADETTTEQRLHEIVEQERRNVRTAPLGPIPNPAPPPAPAIPPPALPPVPVPIIVPPALTTGLTNLTTALNTVGTGLIAALGGGGGAGGGAVEVLVVVVVAVCRVLLVRQPLLVLQPQLRLLRLRPQLRPQLRLLRP